MSDEKTVAPEIPEIPEVPAIDSPFDKIDMPQPEKAEAQEKPKEGKPPKERPKTRLESMSCWPEVLDMLKDGTKIWDIVRFIQDTRGEYTDVKADSVRVTLYSWMSRNQAKMRDAVRIPTKHLTLMNGVETKVDPLDAVNMLFAIQVDRIMIDYEHERKRQESDKNNNANIKLANDMVKTMSYLMMDRFKYKALMAGGNTEPSKTGRDTLEQIESVKRSFVERFGHTAAAVALDSESRRKVFNALTKVRKGDTEPMLKLLKLNQEIADAHKNGGKA